MINLNELAKQSFDVSIKRGQGDGDFQTLKHCAGEVIEATGALGNYYYDYQKYRKDYQLELADVVMCILTIFGSHEWDIEQALQECLEKNKARIK